MTWLQFVEKVEMQLAEQKIPRETQVTSIAWDRDGFGGPPPDIYVMMEEGGISVTED